MVLKKILVGLWNVWLTILTHKAVVIQYYLVPTFPNLHGSLWGLISFGMYLQRRMVLKRKKFLIDYRIVSTFLTEENLNFYVSVNTSGRDTEHSPL